MKKIILVIVSVTAEQVIKQIRIGKASISKTRSP